MAWYKHGRGWANSRQLCKPEMKSRLCITVGILPTPRVFVSGYANTGKKFSIAFIKYFWKIIQQMKENADFFTFWLKQIFLTHAHIPYQPIKMHVWQYITNQNSWDVTAVFTYSHLNTAIDQWECAYYPNNYFIKQNAKHKCTPCYTVLCHEACWHCVSSK